jgi:acyl-homoserine-lactone acylase
MLGGCAPITTVLQGARPADERMARSVTIVRDAWGVPTIYAPTDAGVAFGVAWAQAEDNFWQVEEDYIHALGRASHYYGDRYLENDLVRAAFEVERLAREEYEREPAERKAVWDAFAAGLNYYLRTVPDARPRLIAHYEPWMPFAITRTVSAGTTVDGVRLGQVAIIARDVTDGGAPDGSGRRAATAGSTPLAAAGGSASSAAGGFADAERAAHSLPHGSNMWAVAGARTAAGHPLILQNPHVGFFGAGQPYEVQVHSDSGWHVRGYAVLGTPVPRAGHNEHFAWSHTETGADHADAYEVQFDHPTDPLLYRYDDGWRQAEEWDHTLQVNTAQGVVSRVYRFRRTHHGPIVAQDGARAYAVRMARMPEGGALQQWYAMGRARSLDEFRTALDQRALAHSNTMYADRAGNIYYLHGNAVPRRDPSFDWSRPLDGGTSATEWQGWHALGELPQLLNPASGWIQNTNSTPFRATADGHNPDPADFPTYMAPEPDNGRARASRRLLESQSSWTLEAWESAAFDSWVAESENAVRRLVHEWEEIGGTHPQRAMRIDEAVDALRSWNGVATVESAATTLFVLWQERLRLGLHDGAHGQFRALEDVVAELRRDFGRVLVPWGEVNRLQRVHTSGSEPFRDDQPSLPVAGAPGWAGVIFSFYAQPGPGVRRYGTRGHTWVSVAELAPQVRSRSVVQFGQSADPASRHFFDQAPLYARGELRQAWFTPAEVEAAAVRSYHPGPAAPVR